MGTIVLLRLIHILFGVFWVGTAIFINFILFPALKGDPATMAKATTGQVFSTKQALELGLVDKEGFLDDAIDRAIELAGLSRDATKVVKYKRPQTFTDMLLGARGPNRPALDLKQFLDLTTPRAYYLFAWPHAAE